MSKFAKTLVAASMTAALFGTAAASAADLTGNVGATSNYLWRGITQSNDQAAVSGGIDYKHPSGVYVGTWTSSLEGSDYEDDLYAGYTFDAGGVSFDVGAIDYLYPLKTPGADDSFYEGYIGVSVAGFSAKVSHSPDVDLSKDVKNPATYIEAAYVMPVSSSSLKFHVGNYSFDKAINDKNDKSYVDYSISLSKDEFTFGVSKTNLEYLGVAGGKRTDDTRLFVSYTKGFDL